MSSAKRWFAPADSNAKAEQGSNVKKIGIKVEKLRKNEMSS